MVVFYSLRRSANSLLALYERTTPETVLMALVLSLLVLCFAHWAWHLGDERRAVEQLPAIERRALYEQTRDEVQRVCRPPIADGFVERCDTQCVFLSYFPECDGDCRDLIRRSQPRSLSR